MSDPSNLPDKPKPPAGGRALDRAALERVLARASELQAGTGDASESLTEAQLIELGKEVGLSPEHVRQAIAEEQTRVAVREPEGRRGVFGPTTAWAQRVIIGTQSDVLARIDQYMAAEEHLRVRRRYGERVTWEARRDFVGSIKRGFSLGGRAYALTRADEVGATVVPVDATRVLVRLDASFGAARQRSVTGGSVLAGTGVVGAGGLLAVAASFPGSSMPIAMIIGSAWAALGGAGFVAVARSYRSAVDRAQLALEQALDRLEHGGPPGGGRGGSILDVLSSALNR
jgi:hypothetical protein